MRVHVDAMMSNARQYGVVAKAWMDVREGVGDVCVQPSYPEQASVTKLAS